MKNSYPLLRGNMLFRENEQVYINRSDELEEYCNIMHRHDFIELVCVISGYGVHRVADMEYGTSKGDIFIINYDVPHGFFCSENSAEPLIVYNCVFLPQFLDVSLFSASHFEEITSSFLFKTLVPDSFLSHPDMKLSGANLFEVSELFGKMYGEYKQMEKGYTDIIRAYLIELLIKLFRYAPENTKRYNHGKNAELIQRAIEYMNLNYPSDVSLSTLAMQSLLSRNYFSKLFKEVTGTNVSDYIQYLRTEKACELLKSTDRKIIDIAEQVGFSDIKFFYEVFRKITGKTPGEYRKTGGFLNGGL